MINQSYLLKPRFKRIESKMVHKGGFLDITSSLSLEKSLGKLIYFSQDQLRFDKALMLINVKSRHIYPGITWVNNICE